MPAVPPTSSAGVVDTLHGVAVSDPFRWLEDGESPDTRHWVEQQNLSTRKALDARPDRGWWHERLLAQLQLPTAGGVALRGDRLFVLERPAGAEQFQLVVRHATELHTEPRTLFDPSAGSDDAAVALDWFEPSPDGSLVAYGVSHGGDENSTLAVLDVASGARLTDSIPNCRAASIAWAPDAGAFWYTTYPHDDNYHRHVRFHQLGADWHDERLVWSDADRAETWPDVAASADGRHLLVHAMVGWGRTDVHLLDIDAGEWTVVTAAIDAETQLTFGADGLIGVTTIDAPKGRLVTASLANPQVNEWRTLIPESDRVLGSVRCRADEVLVTSQLGAVDSIWCVSPVDGTVLGEIPVGVVTVDGIATDRAGGGSSAAFFSISSFVEPAAVWRWTPEGGLQRWSTAAPGPLTDASQASGPPEVIVTQHRYPSKDGTSIGLFLMHRHDVVPGAEVPLILYGYGGFAISIGPMWLANATAWCQAGGVFALAGLRGGLEEGEAWHHAGRRANKQNVYDDFHAAGDWLVANGLASRPHLGILGRSNGGLLVGVAMTQHPDACRAVACTVPLLDMIRFPRFLIAKLWTDEYGDPDVEEEFAWLLAYSPYHHVVPGVAYPAVLLATAEGDSRVDPCHARKMAALLQLRGAGQDRQPVLFSQEGRAGHGVGKPVNKRADEYADELTFMAWQLGLVSQMSTH
jgi:prolyl oligopeptidase